MEQLIAQVVTVAKGMWRYRWPALAVAWVVAIVGVVIVFRVPDKFEASARIYVDTQSILRPLMSGLTVQPNVDQQVAILSRTLISRPNMEKLIRMADLDLKAQTKAEQDELVTSLMGDVQIKSVGRDNLYVLSYRNSDPPRAQRVIQSLVSMFVESSLGGSRKDTEAAKTFLTEQIKDYEAKLAQAEARLKEFRVRNIEMSNAEGKDSASRLGELGEQLKQAKLALKEAEQAKDAARQMLRNSAAQPTPALPDASLDMSSTSEIDERIAAQNRNLDMLLQRFTEQHPDVIAARRLIKDLESQKRKELEEQRAAAQAAASAASDSAGALAGGMAQQEMSRMLATYDVQVASLRARVDEYEHRYKSALEQLKMAPEIEAEAARLNRDYSINKKNYEDLVSRREAASMSGELDTASGVADFRLIDPPRVSPNPVAPNRLLLLPMAFAIALGAGLFTAFAASQLRPVFHSAAELRAKIEVPLLGMVSMLSTATEIRRQRMSLVRFFIGSGGLVGSFVLVFIAMSILAARRVS